MSDGSSNAVDVGLMHGAMLVDQLGAKAAALQLRHQNNAAVRKETEALRLEGRRLEEKIALLGQELAAAEEALAEKQAPRLALEAQIAAATKELGTLIADKNSVKGKVIDLQHGHDTDKSGTVEMVLERLAKVEGRCTDAKKRAAAASEGRSLARVEHDIEMAKLVCTEMDRRTELERLKEARLEAEKATVVLRLEVHSLEAKVEPMRSARAERDRRRDACERLWSEIGDANAAQERDRERVRGLRVRAGWLAEVPSELAAAEAKLKELVKRRAALKADIHRHAQAITDAAPRQRELREQINGAQLVHQTATARLERARAHFG